ncbi:MAG: RNA 2',3'-cyclic phosphodiesterase [Gammaproteobacteria bacterium]|nr:RNA 2',3'-cyclic phosphodiesterase [Gammaproteobacteria bacterium]
MQRLFLALWPVDNIRDKIAEMSRALSLPGRPIAAVNLHVTLVFLGAVDEARRRCVEQAASAVPSRAFELTFSEVQWRARTRIAWAVAEAPEELLQLVASLNETLRQCGHVPDPRPFRPHITLARDVVQAERCYAIAPIHWSAQAFCLVASPPGVDGSEYSVQRCWPLVD